MPILQTYCSYLHAWPYLYISSSTHMPEASTHFSSCFIRLYAQATDSRKAAVTGLLAAEGDGNVVKAVNDVNSSLLTVLSTSASYFTVKKHVYSKTLYTYICCLLVNIGVRVAPQYHLQYDEHIYVERHSSVKTLASSLYCRIFSKLGCFFDQLCSTN